MKSFLTILLFLFLTPCLGNAKQYDDAVDAHIRKKYNAELPPLPDSAPSKTDIPHNSPAAPNYKHPKTLQPLADYNPSGKTYTLKNGTKLILISQNKASNWNAEGSKVQFLLQNPVSLNEGAVIPSGAVLKGTVVNSHAPQITGNGGLLKLKINEIYYNGLMSAIDADLTKVNSKKVFFNNIKGKRRYLQNCKKAMTPGKKTYKTMKKAARALSPIPVINILSIIPYTIGAAAYIINLPIAPLASVFMKGGAVSIPAGTAFYAEVSGTVQIRG